MRYSQMLEAQDLIIKKINRELVLKNTEFFFVFIKRLRSNFFGELFDSLFHLYVGSSQVFEIESCFL